jgi:hypothetical protein
VIRGTVPDHDELAIRDLGAEPAQHVDGVLTIGPGIGPNPHLAFVIEV